MSRLMAIAFVVWLPSLIRQDFIANKIDAAGARKEIAALQVGRRADLSKTGQNPNRLE